MTETEPETDTGSNTETETDTDTETVTENETETVTETETETEAETEAETETETEKEVNHFSTGTAPGAPGVEPVITDNSYKDDNISIEIKQYRYKDTSVYVADIVLTTPTLLRTAFAKDTYGKNIIAYTSVISKNVNAILAVNGDYYGTREKGYVIRNGVLYRSKKSSNNEDLVIYQDGYMEVINENNITAEELYRRGAQNVLSFGPGLISDGEISVSTNQEVRYSLETNPRTAIAFIDDLHFVFIVSDGRTSESHGLTLYELATFIQTEVGAVTAYNLDGGGSSTMVFNGKIVNKPTTTGKISERGISDIVYIGY
ncbi:MAG: phosphodiester glycosidase family protein [Clostridia bacterium]|nr:phosphodiester glycosidase family protein [Clostridia bacterium]